MKLDQTALTQIGAYLRGLRGTRSQADIAARLRTTPGYVSNVERGATPPSLAILALYRRQDRDLPRTVAQIVYDSALRILTQT